MALCLRKAGSKMRAQAALPHRNIQGGKQDQVAVVHQPSDKGGCHLLIMQYVDPSGEFQICIRVDDFLLMELGKIVK